MTPKNGPRNCVISGDAPPEPVSGPERPAPDLEEAVDGPSATLKAQ